MTILPTAAHIQTISGPNKTLIIRLHEVCIHCLPFTPCSAPGSTCIPVKTAASTALPLVPTALKPKVQGLNPVHDIFLITFFLIITFMCSCTATVCNTPQPAHRAGTPISISYAKQKHLGCKKVQGQSEATLQTGRCSQQV